MFGMGGEKMKIFQGMTAKDLIEELQKIPKPELFFY